MTDWTGTSRAPTASSPASRAIPPCCCSRRSALDGWRKKRWHPDQQVRFLEDGRFELSVPYDNARELIMDVLKYGPDVEVVQPAALRHEIGAQLAAALSHYERP